MMKPRLRLISLSVAALYGLIPSSSQSLNNSAFASCGRASKADLLPKEARTQQAHQLQPATQPLIGASRSGIITRDTRAGQQSLDALGRHLRARGMNTNYSPQISSLTNHFLPVKQHLRACWALSLPVCTLSTIVIPLYDLTLLIRYQ